jgi:hypothetical protein
MQKHTTEGPAPDAVEMDAQELVAIAAALEVRSGVRAGRAITPCI